MWKKSCGFNNSVDIDLSVCYVFFSESASRNTEYWDLNSQRLRSGGLRLVLTAQA